MTFFKLRNAFVWMRHTLNWLKWTCYRKAEIAPEHLLGMFYIPHWNGQELTAHPFWSWQICCASLNEKFTCIWKQHFFQFSAIQFFMFLPVIIFPSSFPWVRSCFLAVSYPFCQHPVGGVALYLSVCELQHASNPSVNSNSSSVHTCCNFQWLFVYSFSVA